MIVTDIEACLSDSFNWNKSNNDTLLNSTELMLKWNMSEWVTTKGVRSLSDVHTDPVLEDMKKHLRGTGNAVLCTFGIVGNILNIIVLTRRRLQAGMDSMETAAHINLVALAVSDLLYCLFALPKSFQHGEHFVFPHRDFWVYYNMYGTCFQNIFSKTSTWLTVVMAIGRFGAICHPLRAREFVHEACTRTAIFITFAVWTLLHIPQFWNYKLEVVPCANRDVLYMIELGEFERNRNLNMAFSYIWAVLGFFLPLPLLCYCNVCLIRAFRASTQMRRHYRVHENRKCCPGSRVTPTLILIVIMYLVLVTPSEIISFIQEHLPRKDTEAMLAAMEVANFLHTINFASNFVLYCAVNVHFRKSLLELLYMILRKRQPLPVRTTSWVNPSSKTFISNVSETQT